MSELYKFHETTSGITKDGHTMFKEDIVKDLNSLCVQLEQSQINKVKWQEKYNILEKENLAQTEVIAKLQHPDFLLELSKQLNEQGNRMTADPLFCVYYDEKIPTSEDYAEGYEWFNHEESEVIGNDDELFKHLNECHIEWLQNYAKGQEVEVSDVTIDDLEWETLPDRIEKAHYLKKKHFVKASLTEAGAQQFIDRKQHDYAPLYIYAESMCYQWQMIELRKWLLSLHEVQGE